MKTTCLTTCLFIIFFLNSCISGEVNTLKFTNPLSLDRIDEVLEYSADEFISAAGEIPADTWPLFIDGTDTLISQCIDLNDDGEVDEVLVRMSLAGNQTKEVKVVFVKKDDFPVFPNLTNIHFANISDPETELNNVKRVQSIDTNVTSKEFQMEGPAWENEKVGFRNYFDLRNGMDIFGKLTENMVMDGVGVNENYHAMNPWGMDVLKVANSLGAGAIALMWNDSLYRIGDNGYGSYELLYEGPLKSEFRFSFPDWQAGDKLFDITNYISITAGKYCYKSSLYLENQEEMAEFVSGIVNAHSNQLHVEKVTNSYTALLTNDVQAENKVFLGMALLIPSAILNAHYEAPDTGPGITQTYYATMKIDPKELTSYYFYALWASSNPDFEDTQKALELIRNDALMLEKPVELK